jgi:transcriptional regulator with XRE-family HTH domain
MEKNTLLDEFKKSIPADIKREIDLSFAIADRIYDILKKQKKSQRYLANALGKSESEISKWLRGTHNFTTQTITRIEAVLGEPIIEVTGKPKKTEYVYVNLRSDYSISLQPAKCETNEVSFGYNWISASFNESKNALSDC